MSAILYPVAPNAEQALASPLGRAAREHDAAALASQHVTFVTEAVGPSFETVEAAQEAWKDRLGESGSLAPEDRYCDLRAVMAPAAKGRPQAVRARAVYKDGRRWAPLKSPPKTAWRLSISYWRVAGAEEIAALDQARKARKNAGARLDAETLRALSRQPLRSVRPQQPLDIGLFEYRPPEAPHIIMPDE